MKSSEPSMFNTLGEASPANAEAEMKSSARHGALEHLAVR